MTTIAARDIVQETADALAALVATVPEITGQAVYLYDVEDVKFEQGKKGFDLPAVCILYNSMALAGNDKRGTSADLIFDLYVIAGRDRMDRVDRTVKAQGTNVLAALRSVLLEDCAVGPSNRPWEFMREQPVGIDEDWIVYLQRWRNRVLTIC